MTAPPVPLLALLLGALLQAAAPPADSVDAARRGGAGGAVRVEPYATPVYRPFQGVGVGAGVAVRDVAGAGSAVALDGRLLTHFQGVRAAAVTGDPAASRVYGAVVAYASTTDRRRYVGLGPAGLAPDNLFLSHDRAGAEVRVGVYPFGTTALLVRPVVGVRYDRSGGAVADAGDGALGDLDAASRAAVVSATGTDRYGLSAGLALATDLRDRAGLPRRGTFAGAEYHRFVALDGSGLQLDEVSGSAVLYVPLGGRAAAFVRGVGAVTRRADADGPVPFVYLPVLDDRLATPFGRDRLTGRDVLAGGAGVRVPVFSVFGLYGLDATVAGYLGNAYRDVVDEFEPAVSFDGDLALGGDGRAPLRPALALDLSVVDLARERVVLGGALGLTPQGLTVAAVRLEVGLAGR